MGASELETPKRRLTLQYEPKGLQRNRAPY
jgi:hypothetical protein